MSILVTGAAGFIGFHLLKSLDIKGVGIDNFDPYYDVTLKRRRVEILKQNDIDVVEGDVTDHVQLLKLIDEHHITTLVHLAAQAGVRYSLVNPQAYLQANVNGFLSVLEAVRARPHIKLIYASSSSVYGTNEKLPYAVGDRTDRQASFYGVTKKTNELMAQSYHHLFNLDLVGLRFFTVYGPWGRPDMAYFLFTKAILEERAIDLYNFGDCLRDFTYIDDIVKGIKGCFNLSRGNFLFNLGNHRPVTLSYFVETLEKLLHKEARKNLLPPQPGDVIATFADIEESQKMLNFQPTTSVEEGLYRFTEWYKEFYPKKG